MKQCFSIKLYRSLLYKVCNVIIVILSLFVIFSSILYISLIFINDLTFYDLFFEKYANSIIWKDTAFILGTVDIVKFVFGIIFYLFLLMISLFSLFKNRIIVYEEYIKIQFAPRYLKRYVNLKNIIDIVPIQSDDISLIQRIKNFNFSKKHLYKITTKYNETIILACVDKSGLERLRTKCIAEKNTGDTSLSSFELG